MAYYETFSCACAVSEMRLHAGDEDREPLVPLSWEHPRSLERLRARVLDTSGIALDV